MGLGNLARLRDGLIGSQIVESLDITQIMPSKFKIRRELGDLTPLITSIKHVGLLEPIFVRPDQNKFEIVCGHRRFNACKRLGFKEISCIIGQLSEKAAFETGLVENLQRENLEPIDEAQAFKEYVMQFGWGSISRLAKQIGKSEEYVSHRLLLLSLSPDIMDHISNRDLSASAAKELVWLKDPILQEKMMKEILEKKMSVKKIHHAVQAVKNGFAVSEAVELAQDSNNDDDDKSSGIPTYRNSKRNPDSVLVDKTIVTLRLSMIRLDRFIEESRSPHVRQCLLSIRYKVHQLVDESIKKKIDLFPPPP